MEKIEAVFPRTFRLLGPDRDAIVRAFVDACPPADISRIENARQFHVTLAALWQREPPHPPCLPDVAACEWACAEVRAAADGAAADTAAQRSPASGIRRRPGIVLLRSAFDIRAVFETGAENVAPLERDTPLIVAADPTSGEPRIIELAPEIFELLAALDDWIDPAAYAEAPALAELIGDLVKEGLVEVRP
jgi:hypothetical protein